MSGSEILSLSALEAVIGPTPPAMHLKVIDHLDSGALHWISRSPVAFVGFGDASRSAATIAGGAAGFAQGDAQGLRIPLAAIDDASATQVGAALGALFLLPGIGETLRVNGVVTRLTRDDIHVAVRECYGHCAKALIRSDLWTAAPLGDAPRDPADFVAQCRFIALATIGRGGDADLSPKGDPAGCMARLDGETLWFADRPGNRRVDSFRNILDQPEVALLLLIPGARTVAAVRGRARLTIEESVRASFAVADKTPLLAIGVEVRSLVLRHSDALERACLWPTCSVTGIEPAKLFVEHIKLNRTSGIGARLARAAASVPGVTGLMKKGLEKDYEDNLY